MSVGELVDKVLASIQVAGVSEPYLWELSICKVGGPVLLAMRLDVPGRHGRYHAAAIRWDALDLAKDFETRAWMQIEQMARDLRAKVEGDMR